MPINLKDHAVFIERLQMEMVPLSVAQKAVNEVNSKVDEALALITKGISDVNNSIQDND